jgi:hypothetical protein
MRKLVAVAVVTVATQLVGCAGYSIYDAPWDPKPGRAMFNQIPNWEGEANLKCGGHLAPEDMKPGMSRRC